MSDPALEKLLASLKIRDPLGEISARAHELWRETGSPASTPWYKFIEQAESDLMAGRSKPQDRSAEQTSAATTTARDSQTSDNPSAVHSASDPLAIQDLGHIVATAFPRPLNDHEVICLVRILRTHEIILGSRATVAPLSLEEALRTVIPFTCDYSAAFLAECKTDTPLNIPEAKRIAYWRDIIADTDKSDAPLTSADRNTLHRIFSILAAQPLIASITNQEL